MHDSMIDVLQKMSEGNPGALTVLIGVLNNCEKIDPDNSMGGLGVILSLDTLNIYGSKIWMLFKDVCNSDIATMMAVLRGYQLGYISYSELTYAIENRGASIDVFNITTRVCEFLPKLKLNAETE